MREYSAMQKFRGNDLSYIRIEKAAILLALRLLYEAKDP